MHVHSRYHFSYDIKYFKCLMPKNLLFHNLEKNVCIKYFVFSILCAIKQINIKVFNKNSLTVFIICFQISCTRTMSWLLCTTVAENTVVIRIYPKINYS